MDIPTHAELVERYEAFCRRHDIAETRFGREATGEPQLIQSIRTGRSPSLKTLQRVAAFMAEQDSRISAADPEPSPDNSAQNIGEADSRRPFSLTSFRTTPLDGAADPRPLPSSTGDSLEADAA